MTSDTMRALLLNAEDKTAAVQTVPRPIPQRGELLIRVEAVALNPVDAIYVMNPLGETGRTVGSDFAGTVLEANSTGFESGERVAGFLQGACSANDRPGAFAELVVCPADLVWRVPDSTTFEEAAAVNLCALTAAQGIFYRLGLKAPFRWEGDDSQSAGAGVTNAFASYTFFIYGASTSVGMYAAQLVRWSAKASGAQVKLVGAASKARFPLLQAEPYAYDALVDYRESDWPDQVRALAGKDGVDFAYDCISEGQTVKLVSSTLREGGKVAVVRSSRSGAFDAEGLALTPIYGAVWEAFGVAIQYPAFVIPASEEARVFAGAFYSWLSGNHRLAASPLRLMPGGMEKIAPDGLTLLGSGSVRDRQKHSEEESWMKPISAEKLVYKIGN